MRPASPLPKPSTLAAESASSPRPKWWLLHATNYVVMGVFVASIMYHIRDSSTGVRQDTSSLFPMLLIWSCCMAYFFGFFGISFVDKDEDLDDLADDAIDQWRRELASSGTARKVVEQFSRLDNKLATVEEEEDDDDDDDEAACPVLQLQRIAQRSSSSSRDESSSSSSTRTRKNDSRAEAAAWNTAIARLRNEKDAARSALVVGKHTSLHHAQPVGPLLVCGVEVIVPLARALADTVSLADSGCRALRLSGGVRATTQTIDSPSKISCCVATPSAGEAAKLAEAADGVIGGGGVRIAGRFVYVDVVDQEETTEEEDHQAAARALVTKLAREANCREAHASAVSFCRQKRRQIVTVEATLPGPVVKRSLGATVGDICAADNRARLAGEGPWTARDAAEDVLGALSSATGEPLQSIEQVGRIVVEAVNRSRDLHVSLALPAALRPVLPKQGSFLDLVHDPQRNLRLDQVAAATLLATELARLAATALGAPQRARCGC